MNVLFNIYIRALMRGNPIAILITIVGAGAISVGPFYDGISKRDPVAIGMMIAVILMFSFVIAVAIIDRRSQNKSKRPGSGGGSSKSGQGMRTRR